MASGAHRCIATVHLVQRWKKKHKPLGSTSRPEIRRVSRKRQDVGDLDLGSRDLAMTDILAVKYHLMKCSWRNRQKSVRQTSDVPTFSAHRGRGVIRQNGQSNERLKSHAARYLHATVAPLKILQTDTVTSRIFLWILKDEGSLANSFICDFYSKDLQRSCYENQSDGLICLITLTELSWSCI